MSSFMFPSSLGFVSLLDLCCVSTAASFLLSHGQAVATAQVTCVRPSLSLRWRGMKGSSHAKEWAIVWHTHTIHRPFTTQVGEVGFDLIYCHASKSNRPGAAGRRNDERSLFVACC